MEKIQVLKRVGKILTDVLLYVFIAICIISVIFTIATKKDTDGTATLFGRQMRLVLSPSMEKCDLTDVTSYDIKDIPTGSMIFIELVPKDEAEAQAWYRELKVGDVLTFKYVYTKQETITHRITKIEDNGEGYTIWLEGDNKSSDSETLAQVIDTSEKNSPNYVIGKVTGQSRALGFFIRLLRSSSGLILIVILPSMIIVISEAVKIARLLSADKRSKAEAEMERQQEELIELRRRLSELEEQKNLNKEE